METVANEEKEMITYSSHVTARKSYLAKVRREAGVSPGTPIIWIDGDSPPTEEGDSYYYTNKSGDIIHFPSAYMKWGRPIYHPSTRRVVCGRLWKP